MTGEDSIAKRILVVDDNVMSRAVIERRLTKDGYGVLLASSGMEALSVVSREPVDLIFLDLVMEGLEGVENTGGMDVLTSLKSDERYRHIPIVIISGTDDADAITQCKAAGASDFLPKPVEAEILQKTVINLLGDAPAAASGGGGVAATGASVEASPVFDPASIEQLKSDYDKETTAEFIAKFEEMAPGLRDTIAAARDTGDAGAWNRAAHDLKSGARTMGLMRLAAICRDIELACNDERLDDAGGSSDTLNEHYNDALKALGDYAAGM